MEYRDERCDECRWSRKFGEKDVEVWYECKFNPPGPVNNWYGFPFVRPEDFCSKFEQKYDGVGMEHIAGRRVRRRDEDSRRD